MFEKIFIGKTSEIALFGIFLVFLNNYLPMGEINEYFFPIEGEDETIDYYEALK